jgi:hypothetical protein
MTTLGDIFIALSNNCIEQVANDTVTRAVHEDVFAVQACLR